MTYHPTTPSPLLPPAARSAEVAASTPLIRVRGVDQVFRTGFWLKPQRILDQVSLEVPRRSVFGFIGPNGAGKTTLIHLLVAIRRPVRGTVEILRDGPAGAEYVDLSEPSARERVGYLPERPYFHDHLTGEGLLRYFGALSGMSRDAIEARLDPVLDLVGMRDARHRELKRYSKGMLQRIGIAQAILHDPELLVFDEPMSGLDPVGRKEIRELVVMLAAQGKTIFFSTHVIPDVEAICDQVALIQRGRIVECGPTVGFLGKGSLSVELGLGGITLERARALAPWETLREIPEGLRGVIAGSQADTTRATVRALLDAGAHLLWMTPIRPSLEDRFGQAYERRSL